MHPAVQSGPQRPGCTSTGKAHSNGDAPWQGGGALVQTRYRLATAPGLSSPGGKVGWVQHSSHLGEVVVHALGELLHTGGALLGQLLSELGEACDVADQDCAVKALHAGLHHSGRPRPCHAISLTSV